MAAALDLVSTYLGLDGNGGVAEIPVGPDFWETIDKNPLVRRTLVMTFDSDADWANWEMHPKGGEVILLVSGDVTMVLDHSGREELVPLAPGQAVVVPAGVWHTARVRAPSRMLFLTFGEGTQQRPVDRR
jgi:mannose-6-phosphate isomerase-like protein (cupin superfamily)